MINNNIKTSNVPKYPHWEKANKSLTMSFFLAFVEDELIPHFKPLSYAVSVFLLLFIAAIGATWCWLMYCREEEPPMPPPKEPELPTSTYRDHRCSMHKYTRWLMTHWRESKQRPTRKNRCPIGARSTNRSGGSDASEETERRRSKELVGRWLGSLDLLPDGGDRPLLSPGYP